MAHITLRVLDGADRGRVFEDLTTPVTIGREEGNSIQLNDDRISRFHIKIQEDHEKVVLTDLESTNGTKVNGEDIQLRLLRFGDMISLGRSVLLFGKPDQIARRLADLRGEDSNGDGDAGEHAAGEEVDDRSEPLDYDLSFGDESRPQSTLHTLEPPELPERLSPGQAAQLSEVLEYVHIRLRELLETVHMDETDGPITIDLHQLQNLLDLQSRIAIYLRQIGEPD